MRQSRTQRDGLTLIESVSAITLLGILAAFVLSALSSMITSQRVQQHRMGAAEIANRLVLQYLDDPATMPQEGLPVAYNGARFRWALAKSPAKLVPAVQSAAALDANGQPVRGKSGLSLDRLGVVTIRVWLSEESGGSFNYGAGGVPSFALTRLVDPTYIFRNPDSLDNMIKNPERMREFQQMFQSVDAGGFVNRRDGEAAPARQPTQKPANNPQPNTPRPNSPQPANPQPTRVQPSSPAKQPISVPNNQPSKGNNPIRRAPDDSLLRKKENP
jgi:prepilin-type N-terminal cleavage/methylation domain-containing protein